MIDRRLFTHFDWVTFSVALALALVGLVSIYSATHVHMPSIYRKETYWVVLATVVLFAAVLVNYSFLEQFAYVIYGGTLVLLVAVLFLGSSMGGAQRWLDLGFFSLQPSEPAKLGLIIALAKYFSTKPAPAKGLGVRGLIAPGALLAAPFLLIAKQPDLGTALILLLIFFSIAVTVKIRLRTMVGLVAAAAAMVPIFWRALKGYQKARLMSFLDPSVDPMGSGYHLLQSKIAIGSGGLAGKGFLEGTQGKLMFLPEHHTDFIFAILAEEWGFVGSFTVLVLFLTLFLRGLGTATEAKDRFGLLMALGITSMLFWHVVINLGMVSGILPVVGVPLPFISYGGSFLATSMVAVGLLINVKMRRFIF